MLRVEEVSLEFRYSLKLVYAGWDLREKTEVDEAWDRFFELAKRGLAAHRAMLTR
jgi:hypothetical protein